VKRREERQGKRENDRRRNDITSREKKRQATDVK
jgi:hypothetical protein